MSYYVFHATPMKRARVHENDCAHCRDGQGQAGQQKTNSGSTGWNGPFDTVAAADSFMKRQFSKFTDLGHCQSCKPGIV